MNNWVLSSGVDESQWVHYIGTEEEVKRQLEMWIEHLSFMSYKPGCRYNEELERWENNSGDWVRIEQVSQNDITERVEGERRIRAIMEREERDEEEG